MATVRINPKQVLQAVAFACALWAPGAAADGETRAPLQVWAIGLPNGYVVMEQQARVLQISAEDVARGVVEVRGGSRLVITLKSPAGYALDFRARTRLIQAGRIEAAGRTVDIDASGGTLLRSEASAGRHVVAIGYRFVLAADAVPGTYAWPLDVAVRRPVPGYLESPNYARHLAAVGAR